MDNTVFDVFARQARASPRAFFLQDAFEDAVGLRYGEAFDLVVRIAGVLEPMMQRQRRRVALVSTSNSPLIPLLSLASWSIGASVGLAAVNDATPLDVLSAQLACLEPCLIITDESVGRSNSFSSKLTEAFDQAFPEAPGLQRPLRSTLAGLVFGAHSREPASLKSLSLFASSGQSSSSISPRRREQGLVEEEEAYRLFTSSAISWSTVKAVKIPHRSLMTNVASLRSTFPRMAASRRTLGILPLSHTIGFVLDFIVATVTTGGTYLLLDRHAAQRQSDSIAHVASDAVAEQSRRATPVDTMWAVPALFDEMAARARQEPVLLHALQQARFISVAGAYPSRDTLQWAAKNKIRLGTSWGMSEVFLSSFGARLAFDDDDDRVASTDLLDALVLLPTVDFQLVPVDDGAPEGWCELVFGRRDIFTGYVVLDDDRRPVFKPVEETFRTGDVFEIVGRRRAHKDRADVATDDVLTLVRYVGRNDDVVQLAVGEKVLCSAVEQQLSTQDGIKTAFVTGNRSKKEGRPSETLVALVECSGDVDFKRVVAKALAKVNPQLSPAARIGARNIAQVDSLPMTSKGSLFRKKVAAHLVEPLAGLSAAWIARQVRQHLAEIADLDGIGLEDDHEMAALALTSQQSVKVVSFIRQLTGDGSMEPVDVQAQGTVSAFEDVVKSRYVAVAFSQSPAPTGQTVSRQEADQPTRDPRPEPSGTTKISIAGAALRLPGGVDDLEDLWHASVSARGKDGRAILETASQDGRCDAEEAMLHGWLDRRGITDFDPETFGISTSEAAFVKPQQRLVLELALEALQDAGLPPSTLLGKRVGVFVAANGQDGYDKLLLDEADNGVHTLGAHYGHGTHNASLAGRVAHWLGSCGPAMTIETACSGGLTAVHAAQRSLKAGDCDVALVAGVTTFIDPERQFPFRRQAGMATRSPQQQSRAFSSSADGMVPSEGAVAVVLQAQHGANTGARHGEPLAWIESIECEHQGASATMMTTRSDAQSRLIHHALAAAEVEPQAIDVFECHGSATQLGDLVEFGAIRRVFGGSEAKRAAPVAITASKNIFGHTEEAAGLVGLLHAIVSLRHRSSPPSHVSDPNIDFDWAGAGARYSNCRTSLGRGQSSPMHALVSSYGFSGTMCSAVLRAGQQHPPPRQEQDERLANLLFLSAPDRTRLRLVGKACVEHLRNAPHDLEALQAAVHHRGRESFPIRQAIDLGIPRDQSGLANSLGMLLEGEAEGESEMHHAEKATSSLHRSHRPRLVVQFAGMGRIARGAARSFYDNNSVYRKTFEEVSMRFSQHDPSMDLVQAVYGTASHGENEPNALETSTATAQPALFAVYYSLWKATTSLLRQPVDIVFGHSFGEIAAACASGILSLEDAVELVYVRSRCCEATSRHCPGAMLAVRCAKADLVQSGILQPASEIVIAAENAEEAYTISLPAAELESVEARLHAAAIPFRRLKTQSVAFHHPMLHHDSAFSLAAVDEKLARLAVDRAKEAPSAFKPKDSTDKPSFVSCSRPTAPDTLPSWHQHLCQPVHYAQTAEAVLFAQTSPPLGRHREETKAAVVLEIGLGAELSSLTRRRALHSNAANVAVPVEAVSLFGSQGDDCFVETVKRLFELGVDVQLPVSLATRRQPMLALNRRRFWPKGRLPKVGHGQDRPQPQHTVALEKRRGTAAPSSSWSRHQGAEQVQTGRDWAKHHLVCNEEQRNPFSIAAWLSSLLARRSGERTCYIFQDKQPLSSSGNADVVLTARASPGQAGFTVSVTPLEQQSHDGGGAFKHLEATPLANPDELPAWINAYEASSTSAEPSSVHLLDVPNAGNDVVYLLQTSSTAFEALLSCSTMSSMWTCLANVFASLGLDTAMAPVLLDVTALQEGAAEESDALRVSVVKVDDVWRAVVRTVDGDLVCALQSAASNFAPSADGKSSSTHGSPALTSSSFAPSSPFLQGSGSSCCSSVCSLSSSITSHFSGQTTSHLAKLPGADVSNASSDALGTLGGAALRLEPERIESKRQLGDYGLDSFRATHLSEMLDARFGVDVSHVSLLQDMTLGRLRDLVSSR